MKDRELKARIMCILKKVLRNYGKAKFVKDVDAGAMTDYYVNCMRRSPRICTYFDWTISDGEEAWLKNYGNAYIERKFIADCERIKARGGVAWKSGYGKRYKDGVESAVRLWDPNYTPWSYPFDTPFLVFHGERGDDSEIFFNGLLYDYDSVVSVAAYDAGIKDDEYVPVSATVKALRMFEEGGGGIFPSRNGPFEVNRM